MLVMGVCGSGKTETGKELAELLGMRFLDADAFHSAEAVAKMSAGTPLTDADRRPWLGRLAVELACNGATVLACSALKVEYRRLLAAQLAPGRGLAVVFLNPARSKLRRRLTAREHFMPVSLLDSQLATLEPPAAEEPAIQMLISVALMARASRCIPTPNPLPCLAPSPVAHAWAHGMLCTLQCMYAAGDDRHRHRTLERRRRRCVRGRAAITTRGQRQRRQVQARCPSEVHARLLCSVRTDGVQGQCSSRYVRGWTQKAIAS